MKHYPENIPDILASHSLWLAKKGGMRADFRSCDLSGISFAGADLRKARFQHAQLEKANFEGAQLEGANFFLARLCNANLKKAHCKDAFFLFANMTNAKVDENCLKDATLFGANLSGAVPIYNFRLWMRANPMLMMASYMILLIMAMSFGAEIFIRFFL
ncbi:MAG TPA: hypothetical protein DCW68_05765 [Rhodospirillaceae bacterium]|nr:MAG: hypothetical protein A2018_01895 [Alphaproteobacteria bacterium GWF2_58_20]HAU29600.1 hypothetical protein [Rhodospirillaceae bacterium]